MKTYRENLVQSLAGDLNKAGTGKIKSDRWNQSKLWVLEKLRPTQIL